MRANAWQGDHVGHLTVLHLYDHDEIKNVPRSDQAGGQGRRVRQTGYGSGCLVAVFLEMFAVTRQSSSDAYV